jgi:tRNA-specific 2-thiouridylase
MGLRVLAAMSGGVDSATAAARAVDAGHEVTGVHLALSANPQSYRTGARGCCTIEDARDARRAADVIGIPFYVWDMAERFARDVVDDFVAEYAAGRTPNPCLRCNEKIKFEAVLDRALALGFDAVCTGHYARVSDSGALQRAADPGKDQSYVLAVLNKDADGEVLGTHEGVHGYTIGQRKGLNLDRPAPDGRPRYVLSIEPVSNTVTVGPAAALGVREITAIRAVWTGCEPPMTPISCKVQLRAHGEVHDCTAVMRDGELAIQLASDARGVAAGQAAVLYDGETVLGSATISATA